MNRNCTENRLICLGVVPRFETNMNFAISISFYFNMCHVHVFAKVPRYAREDSKPLQPSPHHTIPLDDDVVKRAQNLWNVDIISETVHIISYI